MISCLSSFFYLSVIPGRMKNIQKWMPNTRMTWKITFPITVLRRYRARSTTIVPNWMSTMTRNGPGTWSSDSEDVISAPPWCFCEPDETHINTQPRKVHFKSQFRREKGRSDLKPSCLLECIICTILILFIIPNTFKFTPNAQKPKTIMMKSTVSARNIKT